MMGLRIEQAAQDMQAAVDALLARHEVVGSTVGVTGFCMGGGLALLLGATSPQVRAVSAFYPAMPWADYQPEWSAYAGKVA
ncbi:MAG TPA: dienelactone hydrolase, partial [Actinobacteria bacterium]|nr:dienelactone hydrolase [Actinomycetota bacterium]